jgi:hypothetical protein
MNTTRTKEMSLLWSLASAVSLTTTKRLLERGFHFPMHLLFLQLVAALILKALLWSANRALRNRQPCSTTTTGISFVLSNDSNNEATHRLTHAVSISGAYVCAYQALHHNYNLPIAAVLLGLDWAPRAALPVQSESEVYDRTANALTLVGVLMILVCDFRASVPGISMTLLATVLTAIAQRARAKIEQAELSSMTSLPSKRPSWFSKIDIDVLGLLGSVMLSLFWCRFREQQFLRVESYELFSSMGYSLSVNIIASSIMLATGEFFPQTAAPSNDPESSKFPGDRVVGRLGQLAALVATIAIAETWSSDLPPNISPWQWVGSGITIFAAIPIETWNALLQATYSSVVNRAHSCRGRARSQMSCQYDSVERDLAETKRDIAVGVTGHATSKLLFAVASLWMLLLFQSLTAESVALNADKAVLDTSYRPLRALDIVIARYDEPASEVALHINELLSLPKIGLLNPKIVIYNKLETVNGSSTFLRDLHEELPIHSPPPKIVVRTLPNIGREADTYLEHITAQWDNLANHTLFMQASVHFAPAGYLSRVSDYFVPSTGFLSLSDTGGFCPSCDGCHDRDWTEDPVLLRELYSDFNGQAECKDVVLTYRGQFIASAARLRGNDVELYRRWLDELRDPRGRLHTAPYTEDQWSVKEDSLSAPRVGFTLERIWGMILQCNERGMAERCPSLLSRSLCPQPLCGVASLEECQCLDY